MLSENVITALKYLTRGSIIICFLLSGYGYLQKESDLQDNERVELFNRAFKEGYIVIAQPAAGRPLEPTTIVGFSDLRPADQKRYGQKRLEKMRKQTFRFVAAVNQGLGDPFEYKADVEDRAIVEKIKESSLRYQNPFEGERPGPVTTPINSSETVAESRRGWRIVGRDLVLYLRPGAELRNIPAGAQYMAEVGGEFVLASRGNSGATLRITNDGEGAQALALEGNVSSGGRRPTRSKLKHGDYFVWDGRPLAVYRTDIVSSNAEDTTVGDLVFTKTVNGKPLRIQVLGRATANLIGSPVGGETGYIDGAFLHNKAQRLVLTIDPDIQSAAYFLLYSGLRKLDADHPCKLTRPRQGAITVLDVNTGQMLAHVGAPGYDPLWEAGRVILANRQRIVQNPANQLHMPGSAVKVLTGGVGYLLFGEGSGDMLPTSINQLAIRQAFRNTYGGPMPPEDILTSSGDVVKGVGDEYFKNNGGRRRIKDDFVTVLNSGFYIMDHKPRDEDVLGGPEAARKDLYEPVVLGGLSAYFSSSAKYDFFPLRSRFPVRDADSLELFKQYSIGGNEARFTMLRLAATLATVSTGQKVNPFVIESVFDRRATSKDNRLSNDRANAFSDLRAVLPYVEGANSGNDRRMIDEMTRYLQQVCLRGPNHTGYYISGGRKVFMTEDDAATQDFDEDRSRRGDFGKTGTANNAEPEPFDDSVFVYRHGRFVVAVWMERADGDGVEHPANAMLNQVMRFIEKLEPPRP